SPPSAQRNDAAPARRTNLRARLSSLLWSAATAGLVIFLLLLVAAPLAKLAIASLARSDGSGFTLANYVDAFGNARHLRALGNSLWLGTAVTACCVVVAVPLAWAVSRTDMPLKGLVRLTVIATFITPNYLGGVAWILLAAPRAGWLNRAAATLTGGNAGPFNIYSFTGLVFVVAIYAYPYVFVATSAALDLVSSEMEDAASILGASRLRTALRVTLPLVLPAIFAGSIVVFLDTIALFGTPALIAIPAHFSVMTTQLWNFFEYPVQVEVAAAYCAPLIGVTMFLLWLQRAVLSRKGFVAVTGKGGARRPIRLGRWRYGALLYALLIGALSVFLPFATICEAAFSKAWGRGFSLQNLTLANFSYLLFEYPITQQSIAHTLLYSGIAATACVILGLVVAYLIRGRLVPLARYLGGLVMAPFVIPGIVLGMAFYATFAPPPAALIGTAAIVILAFVARFIPIAYANAAAALRSVNPEMEEAARILGAARSTTIRRILAPLLKTSLAGAWLMVFIPAARELSTALFVVGPQTRVLAILMLDLNEEGNFEILAASGCILLVVMLATLLASLRLLGRDFMLRP
ncbi:MAG TPA: iron ABC transporter permease, partial [Stellaceae bacterium]|nr:iron ABC transporter permease [Stellaceae bacterium]